MTDQDVSTPRSGEIVATAGTYYRVTRYIITLAMVGMGLWFGYDGYIGWPEMNKKIEALEAQRAEARAVGNTELDAKLLQQINDTGKHHSATDILVQKVLFFTLPPIGIALFVRWIWISRGAYRLTRDDVLHVPGHPPVPLDSITELDRRLWDRKGIAYVTYELRDAQRGTLKLDDFIYQREPTDEIFKRIEQYLAPSGSTEGEPQAQSAGS